MAAAEVSALIKAHKVVVFSKSYCPYCTKAKAAFERVGVKPHVLELDLAHADGGAAFQEAFISLTGKHSVPRVFIGGVFLGGGDDTVAAEQSGKLVALLKEAGALA